VTREDALQDRVTSLEDILAGIARAGRCNAGLFDLLQRLQVMIWVTFDSCDSSVNCVKSADDLLVDSCLSICL